MQCITKTTETYLQYLDLFPQKSLRFGQILLIYAFDCNFPIMLLKMSMIQVVKHNHLVVYTVLNIL